MNKNAAVSPKPNQIMKLNLNAQIGISISDYTQKPKGPGWDWQRHTSSNKYGKGYFNCLASSAMNCGPSCEEQFILDKSHNSFNTALIPNYGVIRTCGWVATEFEDIATTASPFCSKDYSIHIS